MINRELCSDGKAKDFDGLLDTMNEEDVAKLKENYYHVDDIDLFVGGFLERPYKGSILGPVFTCILSDTFARLKVGDRFFYDLGLDQNTMFSTRQLSEIRKASMARIVCDNAEQINEIQPQVFKKSGFSKLNEAVFCEDLNVIPKLDLRYFSRDL